MEGYGSIYRKSLQMQAFSTELYVPAEGIEDGGEQLGIIDIIGGDGEMIFIIAHLQEDDKFKNPSDD